MTVIPFPRKPCVVITCRQVFETRHETSAGTDVIRHRPPIQTFFMTYIDEDGYSCCVWDGSTHASALTAASGWAVEGVAVRDQTNRSGWRA